MQFIKSGHWQPYGDELISFKATYKVKKYIHKIKAKNPNKFHVSLGFQIVSGCMVTIMILLSQMAANDT